jgi:uncharacterized protein YcfJ
MTTLNSIIVAAVTAVVSVPAVAENHAGTYEWATVVEAEPIIRIIRRPVGEEVCWQEEVYREVPERRAKAPVVFGALLGGLIGNQFGSGHGRDAMTFAGVALGSAIAKDNQRRNNPQHFYASLEDRCGINTEWQETKQIIGWDVVYEYQGETYVTRMQNEPGERIQVQVSIAPIEN